MTKEQILKKVIEKAVKNGFKGHLITKLKSGGFVTHCSNAELILSHSFAKAFWGEEWGYELIFKSPYENLYPPEFREVMAWEYHLTQLALAKDRLKYLSKFL